MMDDVSVLRHKARRLALYVPRLSQAVLSGNFMSVFKGRGMDFDSLRKYESYDDALRIDWNATARFTEPYIKTYSEDKNLVLYLIIDESASMHFGDIQTKHETAVLLASLLAYVALYQGVQLGALFFAAKPELFNIGSGERFVNSLLERLLRPVYPSSATGSNLSKALSTASTILKRRSLVVILSDFISYDYALSLSLLSRRHDVLAIRTYCSMDTSPPLYNFSVRCADAENHAPRLIAAKSKKYKAMRQEMGKDIRLEWLASLSAAKVPYLDIATTDDPFQSMFRFFSRPKKC